jgi:glutamate dehydrogenase
VSTTTLDVDKSELLAKATDLAVAGKGTGGPPHGTVGALLNAYYRHVAPEDVVDRSEVDVYGALASQFKLARSRPQGTAQVRAFTPSLSEHGWSAGGHSVVEVVTDDMPFLVDSLTMELSRQLRGVHVVIHPHFDVVRDITGALQSVLPVEDGSLEPPEGAVRESWMHVEIDRMREGDEDPTEIEEGVQRVLRDVRESVEDWEKMHTQVQRIVDELEKDPPPLDPDEVRQGRELLQWLAEDHFTFLGYREYRLERDGEDELLRAVAGTGYGILRADQDMSASFGKLPALVKAKAREKTLLVLAKANSRATVHRPAYLDYVGVKRFENGEVVGERRFLGLFSSAAYTESLTRIPLLREKAAAILKHSGFDPRSHAGKALMDTLETYPTSWPRWPRPRCSPASAARSGCSSAATPTAATSRSSSTCPATATTPPSGSGSPISSRNASAASQWSSTSASTSPPPPGSTSSCTRRAAGTSSTSTRSTSSAASRTPRARGGTTSRAP